MKIRTNIIMTALAVFSASASFGQVPNGERGLIAGFDFNQLDEEGFTNVNGVLQNTLDASDTDLSANGSVPPVSGVLHFDGNKGSQFWSGEEEQAFGLAGSIVNNTVNTFRRNDITDDLFNSGLAPAAGLGFGVDPSVAGQSAFSFAFDSSGFIGLEFSLAASVESGVGLINWSYQLPTGSKTAFTQWNLTSTFTALSLNLPTAVENVGEFWLIADVGTGVYKMDNAQLTGIAAIPEPSTYAAILLGFATVGLVLFRRRKEA